MDDGEMSERCRRLSRLVEAVAEQPSRIRRLPRNEQLAVALILNQASLFPDGEYTILQAVNALGADWIADASTVERALMLRVDD